MIDMETKPHLLILGSGSPRRKQLLAEAGYNFVVDARPVSEALPAGILPERAAVFLAEQKADAFANSMSPNAVLITADTVVIVDNQILGKPTDAAHARQMLRLLSGRGHLVQTGVCISGLSKRASFQDTTKVWFGELSEQQIDFYIHKYVPMDKAGAYGIQDWIGMVGIYKIEGSYFNVMGLPVHLLYEQLKDFVDFDFNN